MFFFKLEVVLIKYLLLMWKEIGGIRDIWVGIRHNACEHPGENVEVEEACENGIVILVSLFTP